MTLFETTGLIISVIAVLGYLNARWLKLPDVIGITALGVGLSLILGLAGLVIPALQEGLSHTLSAVAFDEIVFHGMLGVLLFAGALHVNLADLAEQKWVILLLATFGVLLSTLLVGFSFLYLAGLFGVTLQPIHALLFGALIAPTDPIAVLGILKKAGVAKTLETKIAGESLFNDGVGVVVFLTLLGLAGGDSDFAFTPVATLLIKEVVGGLIVGLVLGYVGFSMLRAIDSYAVEILITLAMTTGGYALAEHIHTSAPIAVVVMGLMIGNRGRRLAMSERTREHLLSFWDLTDELLNLLLFGLIGLEVLVLTGAPVQLLLPALLAIPLVLAARFVSVGLPISLLRRVRSFSPHVIKLMTWGGLRGGISIALALSLPPFPGREAVLMATYAVVIFSILVQALSMGRVAQRFGATNA